jgi:hypothetical protein
MPFMPNNTIDIKAGRLFPFHFLILGGILLFAGMIVAVNYPIATAILVPMGLLIVTAYEGTEIDTGAKTFREYNSFLFIKTGKKEKYRTLEGIFIHRAKISQKMFSPRTMNSSTFTHVEYNAYLKTDREKIFLMSGRNKMKLLKRVRGLADALNTPVADHAVFP